MDLHETAVKAQEDALVEAEDAQEAYDLATTLPKASLQAVEQEVGQLWPGLRQIVAIGAAALLLAVAPAIAWTMVFGRNRSDAGPQSPLLADDADDDVFSKGKKRGAQPATAKVASKTSSAGKASPAKGPGEESAAEEVCWIAQARTERSIGVPVRSVDSRKRQPGLRASEARDRTSR